MVQHTESPASPPTKQPESPYGILARKLTLLVLLTLAVTLSLAILTRNYWVKAPLLTFLFANISLALVCGFAIRWVLRNQSSLVRILTGLGVIAAGLVFLGFLTAGRVGIGPWRSGSAFFDWLDFSQLFMGMDAICLCLFAWQLPSNTSQAIPQHPSTLPRKRQARHPRPIVAAKADPDPAPAPVTAAITSIDTKPAKPKRKRLFHRRTELHLSDAQEHRCPYCLELIDPDDARGVVECKICHTLHHADCWAITGACQVPHYTS
jgi:hypothetical protein